jgi:putative membrane protein
MRTLALAAALAAAFALPAAAQTADTKGASPQAAPGGPVQDQANVADRFFVELVGGGGMAEVEFARLADRRAQSNAVKEFARRMIEDHTRLNQELATRAGTNILLPRELGPDDKAMRAELEKASGPAFDLAYMQGQVVDHQKTIVLMQYEIDSGQNAGLKQFAIATLPIIFSHLDSARNVMAELSTQGVVSAQGGATGLGAGGAPLQPLLKTP